MINFNNFVYSLNCGELISIWKKPKIEKILYLLNFKEIFDIVNKNPSMFNYIYNLSDEKITHIMKKILYIHVVDKTNEIQLNKSCVLFFNSIELLESFITIDNNHLIWMILDAPRVFEYFTENIEIFKKLIKQPIYLLDNFCKMIMVNTDDNVGVSMSAFKTIIQFIDCFDLLINFTKEHIFLIQKICCDYEFETKKLLSIELFKQILNLNHDEIMRFYYLFIESGTTKDAILGFFRSDELFKYLIKILQDKNNEELYLKKIAIITIWFNSAIINKYNIELLLQLSENDLIIINNFFLKTDEKTKTKRLNYMSHYFLEQQNTINLLLDIFQQKKEYRMYKLRLLINTFVTEYPDLLKDYELLKYICLDISNEEFDKFIGYIDRFNQTAFSYEAILYLINKETLSLFFKQQNESTINFIDKICDNLDAINIIRKNPNIFIKLLKLNKNQQDKIIKTFIINNKLCDSFLFFIKNDQTFLFLIDILKK